MITHPQPVSTILDTDFRCLYCHEIVIPPTSGAGGYLCTNRSCGAYYFVSGVSELESMPDWHQPDGSIAYVQEAAHGCFWYYCKQHQTFERHGPFETQPCIIPVNRSRHEALD